MKTLSVMCDCGLFSAIVEIHQKEPNTRIVCYCEDCQSYARYLGRSDRLLDANGGTDIIQLSPAHFKLAKGKQYLSVLRLYPNSLLRWYSSCCRTPICNTPPSVGMPYLALMIRNLRITRKPNKRKARMRAINSTVVDVKGVIGPVKFGVCAGQQHPITADWAVAKGFGFNGLYTTLRNVGRWRLRGDQKHSALIDVVTGEPAVAPYTLSIEERADAAINDSDQQNSNN